MKKINNGVQRHTFTWQTVSKSNEEFNLDNGLHVILPGQYFT
jgi:hypothetical protein